MVDALDSAHHTPLFRACEAGHIDVVEALLEGLSQHICRRFSFRVPPVMHSYLALFKVRIRSLTLRSWRSSRRTWYRQTKPTSLVLVKQLLTNLIFIRAALGGYDFICLKLLEAQASVNFPDNQGYCLHFLSSSNCLFQSCTLTLRNLRRTFGLHGSLAAKQRQRQYSR